MNAKMPKFILTILTGLTLSTIASVADCDKIMNISANRGVIDFESGMLTKDVTVTNDGNCTLNIHDIYVHETIEDIFDINQTDLTIPASESRAIKVTYTGPNTDKDGNIYFPSDKTAGKSNKVLKYTAGATPPPVAVDDNETLEDCSPVMIDVLANDTGHDGTIVPGSVNVVAGSGDANITGNQIGFTPSAGGNEVVTIQYTIQNVDGVTDTANVNIVVVPECVVCTRVMSISAHRGVINFDSGMLVRDVNITNNGTCDLHLEDTAYIHESVSNFFSIDTTPLPLTIPAGGSDTVTVTYTGDNTDREGNIYFPSDKTGGKSNKVLRYTADVISSPVAVDDNVTIEDCTPPAVIDVLANDTGHDGTIVSVSVVAGSGSVSITATNEIEFTPNAGGNEIVTLQYTIQNGDGATATGTVNIVVVPECVVCTRIMSISADRGVINFDSGMLVRDVNVTNNGTCDLNIHDIYVHETVAGVFSLSGTALTLSAGSSDTVTVTYTGDNTDKEGNIYFPSDKTGGKSNKVLRYTAD